LTDLGQAAILFLIGAGIVLACHLVADAVRR